MKKSECGPVHHLKHGDKQDEPCMIWIVVSPELELRTFMRGGEYVIDVFQAPQIGFQQRTWHVPTDECEILSLPETEY